MLPPLLLLSSLDTPGQQSAYPVCVGGETECRSAGQIPNNYDQKWPANVMFNYENLT